MSYYNQLMQFLSQAKTDNLKTKHYDSEYQGTEVKVSFGQGTTARIPWISFLIHPNTTSEGIYPVYLYYKELEVLVLAYGVSETKTPVYKWHVENAKTIDDFFEENYSQKPYRYGASYIYRTYNVNRLPSSAIVNQDLASIIDEYKAELKKTITETNTAQLNNTITETENAMPTNFRFSEFNDTLEVSGLIYSQLLITRFIASLLTKPFVILTGLSGSGKTKLAQAFVQWICQDDRQYRIIPVGADWTNREPLLGYPNALKPEEYVKPDSGALDLVIQANSEPGLPHFLILDEMNLSHVERYFADFLSVMESKEDIPLYAEGTIDNGVPPKLKVPANLFIIGTVNIDETTNMFSPKVLDRANTIEFRVSKDEMKYFLDNRKEINMDALNAKGANKAKTFLEMATKKTFETLEVEEIHKTLVQFFGELRKTGAEFGYRSATDILRLIHLLTVLDENLSINKKVDIAIMQKLLPKLHGSRRKLCPVLETLGSFCITGDVKIIKDVFENVDNDFNGSQVRYPLSLEKIARMYKSAIDNGFASFAEA